MRFKSLSRQRLSLFLFLLTIGTGLILVVMSVYVNLATRNHRYLAISDVPDQPVGIVFGAGVYSDGSLSSMLADRVTAAVELYQSGRVRKLLMTGDNGTPDYDEVTAMKQFAVQMGVPATDITLDYAGFSTYESCYRAKAIFGVTEAVLITQQYHLPRAVYTCRQLGVAAIGLGTSDWEIYGWKIMLPNLMRELLAIMKALWEVHITRPQPTFLGPFEGIQ